MRVSGIWGLTAYHRFSLLHPLTNGWWITHLRLVPVLESQFTGGSNNKGEMERKHTKVGRKARGWSGSHGFPPWEVASHATSTSCEDGVGTLFMKG